MNIPIETQKEAEEMVVWLAKDGFKLDFVGFENYIFTYKGSYGGVEIIVYHGGEILGPRSRLYPQMDLQYFIDGDDWENMVRFKNEGWTILLEDYV
jgi:hypothetical protein